MRADRLLQILLLLQQHPRLSARELAARLEVSTRTILRDMEALSAAGVPVYAERGRNGGCVLLPGYRADVSGLTAREAQALFAWSGRAALTELGLADALKSAMTKLSSTLPVELRDGAGALSDAIVVDRRRWFGEAEDVGALPALRHAVVARRRVRIRYASATADRVQQRTVDPWGLVEQTGRWYLVARHRTTTKMFRVSRVERVDVLDQPAHRPDDLDLAREWQRLRSDLEQGVPQSVEVVVRVRPDDVQRFRRICAPMLLPGTQIDPVGTPAQLRMTFRVRAAAHGILLGFGNKVEVIQPADLRHDLTQLAAEVLTLYTSSD